MSRSSLEEFLLFLCLDADSRKAYLPASMPRVRVDYGEMYFETESALSLVFAWGLQFLSDSSRSIEDAQRLNVAGLYSLVYVASEHLSQGAVDLLAASDDVDIWGLGGFWIPLRGYAQQVLRSMDARRVFPTRSFRELYMPVGAVEEVSADQRRSGHS